MPFETHSVTEKSGLDYQKETKFGFVRSEWHGTIDLLESMNEGARRFLNGAPTNYTDAENHMFGNTGYLDRATDPLTITRNQNHWANKIKGVTALSYWNSRQEYNRAGVAVTPRHLLFVEHYPVAVNDVIYFQDLYGNIVTRTVVAIRDIPSPGLGNVGYIDLQIALLNSDLPESIGYLKLPPDNFYDYFEWGTVAATTNPEVNNKTYRLKYPILGVGVDQRERYFSANITSLRDSSGGMGVSTDGLNAWMTNFTWKFKFYKFYPLFEKFGITGDSGNPVCFIIEDELIPHFFFTGGSNGANATHYVASIIDDQITYLDNTYYGIGLGPKYKTTRINLNNYRTYTEPNTDA